MKDNPYPDLYIAPRVQKAIDIAPILRKSRTLRYLNRGGECEKDTLHPYFEIYDPLFSKFALNGSARLLEIGLYHGDSMRLFREYLGKAAYILGVDVLDLEFVDATETIQADSTRLELPKDYGHFDIIIDDGDHNLGAQLATYLRLKDRVHDGGIYVIEDIMDIERDGPTFESMGFHCCDLRQIKNRQDSALAIKFY